MIKCDFVGCASSTSDMSRLGWVLSAPMRAGDPRVVKFACDEHAPARLAAEGSRVMAFGGPGAWAARLLAAARTCAAMGPIFERADRVPVGRRVFDVRRARL